MKWTLEVIVVPVSDLARAREFYAGQLGFAVDHDTRISEDLHIIQLTPPGSGCSIVIGRGVAKMEPGSLKGVQLVVGDVRAAHAELTARGVEVSEVQFAGPEGFRAATDEDDLNNTGFIFFDDPDGNSWAVQQITNRGTD
ncbi:VOC family protein [Crossiella sp. NPDC003009]